MVREVARYAGVFRISFARIGVHEDRPDFLVRRRMRERAVAVEEHALAGNGTLQTIATRGAPVAINDVPRDVAEAVVKRAPDRVRVFGGHGGDSQFHTATIPPRAARRIPNLALRFFVEVLD